MMKRTEKILEYTVVFEPAEEGGYVVFAPALPGCHTQGETFEEARKNIIEAIELYLEDQLKHGEKISKDDQSRIEKVKVSL